MAAGALLRHRARPQQAREAPRETPRHRADRV